MEFLNVETLESAREKLLNCTKNFLSTEMVSTSSALNRILAKDVNTTDNIPHFRRSTVDGYALLSSDTAAAGDSIPVFLTLKSRVEIGHSALISINAGECVEVPTGGMLPEGADAVVMCEYTEEFGTGIAVSTSVAHGENIVSVGEDAMEDTLLLKKGRRILPQDIGALAAAGLINIPVYTPPKVSIISTGDELTNPNQKPKLGCVRDINSYALAALATKHGYDVSKTQVLPDDEQMIKNAVVDAIKANDIVIVSGGSSKGKKDLTRPIFDKITNNGVFTHGIAIKPGKPTILGQTQCNTLLVGLPGHPVSAMIMFELLLGWFLNEITQTKPPIPIPARLSCNVATDGKLTCFPCKIKSCYSGYITEPIFSKSGLITTLVQADGYFIVPRDTEGLQEGAEVFVNLL